MTKLTKSSQQDTPSNIKVDKSGDGDMIVDALAQEADDAYSLVSRLTLMITARERAAII